MKASKNTSRYELDGIEIAIKEIQSLTISNGFERIKVNELVTPILSEVGRIKEVFRKEILANYEEAYIKRYYEIHEKNIVELIDHIYTGISPATNQFQEIISVLTIALEDLLFFIKTYLPEYFTNSVPAPITVNRKFRENIAGRIAVLHEIKSRNYIDQDLFLIALQPLEEFIESKNQKFTFQQLAYFELLQSNLLQIDYSINDVKWIRQSIYSSLIRINYNRPAFFQYFTDHIHKSLTGCETISDRIDQVSFYYKIVNQIDVITNVTYDKTYSGIKEQLLEWITAELDYLKQKTFLFVSSKEGAISSNFKLEFNLSVSQVAYLFKALMGTGVIQNKNTSELIKFITKYIKTKKSESVSYESFRIKFYDAESGTKDAVKQTLQLLTNYINKN